MFRLIFLTFAGHPRDHHAYDHAHESGWQMAVPLIVLAAAAVFVGVPGSGGKWFLDRNPTPDLQQYAHIDFELSSTFKELKGDNPETYVRHAARQHADAGDAARVPASVGTAVSLATGSPLEVSAAEHPALVDAMAMTASSSSGHGGQSDAEHRFHVAHTFASYGSLFIFGFGVIVAALFYWDGRFKRFEADAIAEKAAMIHRILLNKYYVDEFYVAAIVKPMLRLCEKTFEFDEDIVDGAVNGVGKATIRIADVAGEIDKRGVDGLVNKIAASVNAWGGFFSRWQTGNLRDYLAMLVGGFVVLAAVFLLFPQEAGLLLTSFKEIALISLDWIGARLAGLVQWMEGVGAWIRDFFVYFANRAAAVFQGLFVLLGGAAGTPTP